MMTMMSETEEVNWETILDFDFPDEIDLGFELFNQDQQQQQQQQPSTSPEKQGEEEPTWVGMVEELLMKEDDDGENNNNVELGDQCSFSLSDILLDAPVEEKEEEERERRTPESGSEGNGVVVSDSDHHSNNDKDSPSFEENDENEEEEDNDNDDPVSKKRKRQLRNRDAAMRSRERKKVYVKDLEMKSRYLEGECRRLGRLLQCCYAENQMLRISLQSAVAKPESAVLLPELLLLGSLVWFMALICLFPLPKLLLSSQEAVVLGREDRKDLESAVTLRGKGELSELRLPLPFTRSKTCRASRTKMKFDFDRALVC